MYNICMSDGTTFKMATKPDLKMFMEKNAIDFETFFKDFVNDNVDLEDLNDSTCMAMGKLINSIKFWTPKMQKIDHKLMILISTLAVAPASKASLLNVFKALNDMFDLNRIKNLYVPENRNFIGMEFYNEEDCSFVKQNFKMVEDNYVVHTVWLNEARIYQGRIHWLPVNTNKYAVSNFLEDYFIIKELNNAKMLMYQNVYANTNVFEFKALLKNNIELDKIPHIIELEGNNALLTITGRKPLCTNCKVIGHVRKECKYIYCKICKNNVLKEHDCNVLAEQRSYAGIMNLTFKKEDKESVAWSKHKEDTSLIPDSEEDSASWLVVNRNVRKQYGKKAIVQEKQRTIELIEDCSNAENDESEEMLTENKLNSGSDTIDISQAKDNVTTLKRKLDGVNTLDSLNGKGNAKKFEEIKLSNKSLVDKNPYEILSTDESESF